MIDKDYCLSSYIAYRYVWKDGVDFFAGMKHSNVEPYPEDKKTLVKNAIDVDCAISLQVERLYLGYSSVGILLSGGMDSAILASYLKPGSHAYTFTSSETDIFDIEWERAEVYCRKWGLVHHKVNISPKDFEQLTPVVMARKCSPVHSIEPQIYKAALQAKEDGVEALLIGDAADFVFGGLDRLLSKDWDYEAFVKRYYTLDPELVLVNAIDVTEPFHKYRLDNNKIDFMGFMDDLCANESYSSYDNALKCADMPYLDPYESLIVSGGLDLGRIRSGESKYLVRELYAMKYPELAVPSKIPMPRPVDYMFKDWSGPVRSEFRTDIQMQSLTGNQKWQLWCADLFLNLNDPEGKK